MSGVERMEPEAVVKASLFDLERGEVICIPGWPIRAAWSASRRLAWSFVLDTHHELPARYRQPGG